jgi:membrane protease YdiL (CAAX protease family)
MIKPGYQTPVTLLMFLILFAIRIPIADIVVNFLQLFHLPVLPLIADNLNAMQNFTYYLWDRWSFLLATMLIVMNRSRLNAANIDRSFMIVFLIGVGIYCLNFLVPSGWIILSLLILLYVLYKKEGFQLDAASTNFWITVRLTLITFLLFVLVKNGALDYLMANGNLYRSINRTPFILVEELLFRGILWMFLKNLKLSEWIIVFVQAALFWLFHVYYVFTDPVHFWVTIPIISVALGVMTWYSRSITPALLAHFLYNAISS